MGWAEVIARLDELTSEQRALRVLLVPAHRRLPDQAEQPRDGPARPLPGWRYRLDDEFLSNTLFGATCRLGQRYPAAIIPAINGIAGKALSARTYTDASLPGVHQPAAGPLQGAGVRDPA